MKPRSFLLLASLASISAACGIVEEDGSNLDGASDGSEPDGRSDSGGPPDEFTDWLETLPDGDDDGRGDSDDEDDDWVDRDDGDDGDDDIILDDDGYADGDGDGDGGDGDIGRPIPDPGYYPIPGGGPIDLTNCNPSYSYSEVGYCELQYECAPGYAYTYCDGSSSSANCWCDTSNGSMSISVPKLAAKSACEPVMNLCLEGQERIKDAPRTCTQTDSQFDETYCSLSTQCTARVDLGSGITGEQSEYSDVWCSQNQTGWTCDCTSLNEGGRVNFTGAQSSEALCGEVLETCNAGLIDPNKDVRCAPRSQYADSEVCEVQLECSQASTVAGQAVTVSRGQYGACQRNADGSWDCYCGGGAAPRKLQGEDGWEVCSDLATQCSL